MLTPREIQVIIYVADGNKQSAIAALMNITSETVKTHLDKIRRKLGAKNAAEAVAKAFRDKIIN